MNNKGQVLLMSIIVGIMIFVSGMVMLNFLKTEVDTTINSDNLNCDSASDITAGEQISCLIVDSVIPYWILIVVSFAGGVITDRLLI